jgi:hypothetical protein
MAALRIAVSGTVVRALGLRGGGTTGGGVRGCKTVGTGGLPTMERGGEWDAMMFFLISTIFRAKLEGNHED